MSDLVLIGQAPSRTGDPRRPLARGPVASKIIDLLGVDDITYFEKTIRLNLINHWPGKKGKGDAFDAALARNAAAAVAPLLYGHRVLFVGKKVAEAFGRPRLPPLSWCSSSLGGYDYALLPHPSGVSLWWNLPSNRAAAHEFMREVGKRLRETD